ncbi:conserved hypothetical protein [Tenacibaculum dicentrarchi]|uniref:Uncharacterized protein n=1 Tax=Tenacibaculum dicentrarchi TaxID=669041 RepID=A0ABP1ENA6_9FLAO|nr:conserved hypothetical protein [Tenacibaculum dicentrarchi]
MKELIKELAEYLNNNQWLNLVFLLLAISSIVVSYLLYLKSKKSKKPTYIIKSFNLVKEKVSKIEQVKILYDEKVINNLTVSKLSLWNKGKETIDSSDIAPKDKIRIDIAKNHKILNANIIYQKKIANNFSLNLNKSQSSLKIDFDYFHFNEGVVIELYHTGTSSSELELNGTIKGVKEIQKGEIKKDYLIDLVYGKTLGRLGDKLKGFWWKVYFFITLPLFIPIIIITMPISRVYEMTRLVPKEFELNDE